MRRLREGFRDTLVVLAYLLASVAVVLAVWCLTGHFSTAFRGKVDWPVRTGARDKDLLVPAWLLYVAFPTVVLAMASAQWIGSLRRRRRAAAPWWDYTADEVRAMSLDELRRAFERALDELEPLPVTTAVAARPIPVEGETRPDKLTGRTRAERVHERYERLRDAYYERRDDER